MNLLKALARLPLSEVRRLLKASRLIGRRAVLQADAEALRKKLSRIERKLAALDGRLGAKKPGRPAGSRKVSRGPIKGKRGPALRDVLHAVLKKLGRPSNMAELAVLAKKAGYVTRSEDLTFKRAIHQALRTGKQFYKAERGKFGAK
jgi:hypothetical protein